MEYKNIYRQIIATETPAKIVAEDQEHLAFLDKSPVAPGHLLVIPKEPIEYFFDLPEVEMNKLLAFTTKVATAMKNILPCKRVGLTVMGLEVLHVHIHLIPINKEGDMDFNKPRLQMSGKKMEAIATAIRGSYQHLYK